VGAEHALRDLHADREEDRKKNEVIVQ
jgi:hypothetical protein